MVYRDVHAKTIHCTSVPVAKDCRLHVSLSNSSVGDWSNECVLSEARLIGARLAEQATIGHARKHSATALFELQLAWLRALRRSAVYQILFDCRLVSIVCLGVLRYL